MEKVRKQLKLVRKRIFRRETVAVVVVIIVVGLVFSFLSRIPNQAAEIERVYAQESTSLNSIVRDPINAPYKLAGGALTTLSPSVRMLRAVSFLYLVATCLAMYYMLRHWHKMQAALLTTVAFASNAVVLAVGRLGAPIITVFGFYAFAGLLLWQLHSRSNKAVPVFVMIALGVLLYTPGFIWFCLIVGLMYFDRIRKFFSNVKRQAILSGGLISLLLFTPLLVSFINDPSSLKEWLLLPDNLNLPEAAKSVLNVPSAFIYRMPTEPLINVGRLPIFDIATGLLFLIGLNAYRQKISLDRTRIMIASALVGVTLGALGQILSAIVLLMPFAFSILAAGIEYLLDEWHRVFPRNPIAQSFGFLLVTFVVLFGCYYQLTRFFVVWPQTPETRELYDRSRIIK